MENLGKLFAYVIESKKNNNFFWVRGQANNLYIGSKAVADSDVLNYLSSIIGSSSAVTGWQDRVWLTKFESEYSNWLHSSKNNSIFGLDDYRVSFSTGTTQGFDSFYLRHRDKKFKCLVGEYFYHLKSWVSNKFDWQFIKDSSELEPGDAFVISVPFCDTGDIPGNLDELLNACEKLNIPVLIDCCYYSISCGINLNLSYNCIDTVLFGLSKTFPVANLRIGIRYTKKQITDGQTLHSDINYNHSYSAYIGCMLMQKYSPDYIYDSYNRKQKEICQFLNLTPSYSVIFASGDNSWCEYNRSTMLREYQLDLDPDLFNHRICLNSFYENWELFKKFKAQHENNSKF
jgi:hypothetical protein